MVTSRPRARAPSINEMHSRESFKAGAVDVNDVQRRTRDGRRSDHFFDRLDRRSGLDTARAAHVRIHGQFTFGGNAKHVDDFEPCRARSVLNSHADAKRSRVDLLAQPLLHLFHLFRRRR